MFVGRAQKSTPAGLGFDACVGWLEEELGFLVPELEHEGAESLPFNQQPSKWDAKLTMPQPPSPLGETCLTARYDAFTRITIDCCDRARQLKERLLPELFVTIASWLSFLWCL